VCCGRQFESAADNCAVHNCDHWYLTVFDLLEGTMPGSRMANALSYAHLSDVRQIKASGKIVALSVRDNGASAVRGRAEEGLNSGIIERSSALRFSGRDSLSSVTGTLLAHAQTVGQSISMVRGVLRIVHSPLPPMPESIELS
jgi:hypothetical protein